MRRGLQVVTDELRSDGEHAADQELIAGFLSGESECVRQVAAWVRQAAFPYRTRLRVDAEDLHQDLLLEVTAAFRRGAFQGQARLRTYVARLVHYDCLSRLRARRQPPCEQLAEASEAWLRDGAPSPLARTLSHERLDRVRQVFAQMKENCQHLWLRLLAGDSYREMSEALGIAEGTLRVRVLRCRQRATTLWRRLWRADTGRFARWRTGR